MTREEKIAHLLRLQKLHELSVAHLRKNPPNYFPPR
jgi:hypothetical protein